MTAKSAIVKPGTAEHLVLLAARPAGRIEASALGERFGAYPSHAVNNLCRDGLLKRDNACKDVVFTLTPAGREACPARRAIPNRPLHA